MSSPRPFTAADHKSVNALHRTVWWPERSPGGWRWLQANPARMDIDAPTGWVVEDREGRPAAFLGNLVQRFWLGERRLHAATGFSIVVTSGARGASRSLIDTFLTQADIFAGYTLNANAVSAPLYKRHGMMPWESETSSLKLTWILDPVACLHGRVLRKLTGKFPRLTDPYRERFMGRRLRRPDRFAMPADVEPLTDLSDASPYAEFWSALKAEGRLIADRSPETMRWRMADPDATTRPILLAHRRDGRITGYAMAILAKATPIEPVFLEIIDLMSLEGEAEAGEALMTALLAAGRAHGAAKARLQAVSPRLLETLGSHVAAARHEGGWGHAHIRYHEVGMKQAGWSPTPFDADYGVCLRSPPLIADGLNQRRTVTASVGRPRPA